ncbi:fructoselysine-6-P-deglycase FrlB-like protein [Actinoallomurus bryophytorum]|uniref:Fructoselysine-6-P-deglycase FrlB-like protein n=1 Tax=Actinoallomurus bryophytorum TaxID=1490222 RepID=A0A543CQH4_9ACTN|nr:sugar isomerase [Actinoallomurus bryophytorum]TQL99356.1 fructoselysine-6-P-deglycase FrlB-like protein [Actinoallomurus bryophytorum]
MADYHVESEIGSQPSCWREAVSRLPGVREALPRDGESVAVFGCGTSLYMARAYAGLRESRGLGVTDAFAASELPFGRHYDRHVAISRSGTTTEVLQAVEHLSESRTAEITAITAVPGTGFAPGTQAVALEFADERSVVQTRFATSALALLRASLGETVPYEDAARALAAPLAPEWLEAEQITFLGHGWTNGLADEAALKAREAARLWTESYPAMEYRHGPISIAQPGRLTWVFGLAPDGLAEDVAATGATYVTSDLDPMAHLIVAQRLAVAQARAKGMDPDRPRSLTRSVVLS